MGLHIEPVVFEQIADLAIEYKAGARSLRGIFEEMVTPVLYLVPDNPAVKKVVIPRCSRMRSSSGRQRQRLSPASDGGCRQFLPVRALKRILIT